MSRWMVCVVALTACVQTGESLPRSTLDRSLDLQGTWVCDSIGSPDVYRVDAGPKRWKLTNEDDESVDLEVHKLRRGHVLQIEAEEVGERFWTVLAADIQPDRVTLQSINLDDMEEWVDGQDFLEARPDGSLRVGLKGTELVRALGEPNWFGRPHESSSVCVRRKIMPGQDGSSPKGTPED